jgi:hypothetical protein
MSTLRRLHKIATIPTWLPRYCRQPASGELDDLDDPLGACRFGLQERSPSHTNISDKGVEHVMYVTGQRANRLILRTPSQSLWPSSVRRPQGLLPAAPLRDYPIIPERSLSCRVEGAGERTAREARLSHDVVFLGHAAERRVTQ